MQKNDTPLQLDFLALILHRRCPSCEETKLTSEFYSYGSYCKACYRARSASYRTANPGHYTEYMREYYRANKEVLRRKGKEYYHKNKGRWAEYRRENRDRIAEWKRQHRKNNPERYRQTDRAKYERSKTKHMERGRVWAAKNPDKVKAIHDRYRHSRPWVSHAAVARRRARIRGAEGTFTSSEWRAMQREQAGRCLACGEVKPLTMDHIVPLVDGGRHSRENIQGLCRSCNSRKGAQTIDYRAQAA